MKRYRVFVPVGALLFTALMLVACSGDDDDDGSGESAATPTSQPATPIASEVTPEPTETVEPTETAEPTPTPEPFDLPDALLTLEDLPAGWETFSFSRPVLEESTGPLFICDSRDGRGLAPSEEFVIDTAQQSFQSPGRKHLDHFILQFTDEGAAADYMTDARDVAADSMAPSCGQMFDGARATPIEEVELGSEAFQTQLVLDHLNGVVIEMFVARQRTMVIYLMYYRGDPGETQEITARQFEDLAAMAVERLPSTLASTETSTPTAPVEPTPAEEAIAVDPAALSGALLTVADMQPGWIELTETAVDVDLLGVCYGGKAIPVQTTSEVEAGFQTAELITPDVISHTVRLHHAGDASAFLYVVRGLSENCESTFGWVSQPIASPPIADGQSIAFSLYRDDTQAELVGVVYVQQRGPLVSIVEKHGISLTADEMFALAEVASAGLTALAEGQVTAPPSPLAPGFGDTLTFEEDGYTATLYTFEAPVDSGNQFLQPDAGNVYLAIDVQVCAGTLDASFNPYYSKLRCLITLDDRQTSRFANLP